MGDITEISLIPLNIGSEFQALKKESVNENVYMPNSTMLNSREFINSQFNTEWFSHANREDSSKMRYLWFSESFMTDHENV